jgi:MFS family permease
MRQASFRGCNAGMSTAEFLFNPLFGQMSDRFGRRFILLLWPPINTLSRLWVAYFTSKPVYFVQQVFVKMLEYTFENAEYAQ